MQSVPGMQLKPNVCRDVPECKIWATQTPLMLCLFTRLWTNHQNAFGMLVSSGLAELCLKCAPLHGFWGCWVLICKGALPSWWWSLTRLWNWICNTKKKKKKVIQGINKERTLHAEGSLGLDGPRVLSSNSCHARWSFSKKFFSHLSVKMDVVLKVFVSYQQAERAERWHHCPHSGRSPLQDTGLARKQWASESL